MIGYAFSGSFCTLSHSLAALRRLRADGEDILPIMSESVFSTNTRFWQADEFYRTVKQLCGGKDAIHTIVDAEPLGPKTPLDALIICPCTGNTLAKMADGITDTSVTMAAKAHLRSDRPLIIALASNDALSANLKNIATLLSRKHVYFVPLKQDDPQNQPQSLVADFSLLLPTFQWAMEGKQYRKLFL